MQGLESAESTQKRGPFFNLSSLPTSSSFSTPTPSNGAVLLTGRGEEGREGGREGREGGRGRSTAISVPKEVSTLQEGYERGLEEKKLKKLSHISTEQPFSEIYK